MPKKPRTARWTADDVQSLPAENTLSQALAKFGIEKTAAQKKAKRKGVDVAPVIASLRRAACNAKLSAEEEPLVLSLWFGGARVLSVNELFSVLQTRMHETFRYKKACRAMVENALVILGAHRKRAWFDGPTRLTLFRQGAKEMDLDSLATVFKYTTDELRRGGIIDDDNPEVVVEIKLIQSKGAPRLGMRLERLADWVKPESESEAVHRAWFGASEGA